MRISAVYRVSAVVGALLFAALGSCSDQEFAEDGLTNDGFAEYGEDGIVETEQTTLRFAVIGDFGQAGANALSVANLVKSWSPDLVITTGDNNYPDGTAATIDGNIGQFYSAFIYPYKGSYGPGAPGENRFFPSLGNHDTQTAAGAPHVDYFTLPGNERYYEFERGPVHFFAVNSNLSEVDGRTAGSKQATWLKNALAASDSPWKVVYFHHPPYSSSNHGSTAALQWPFKEWGASVVLAGHDHSYERIIRDGFPYFVNGLGGTTRYSFGPSVAGSVVRYSADLGAQLVEATETTLTFKFYTRAGTLIDIYTMTHDPDPEPDPAPESDKPVSVSFTDASDTYIAQHQPNNNFAGSPTIKLDGDAPKGSGRDQRGLIRWDVSAIPKGSLVTAASIKIDVHDPAPGEGYEIVELLTPWSETKATWNWPWKSPGAGEQDRGATPLGVVGTAAKGPLTINLNAVGLDVVQGWVDDPEKNNFGVLIFDSSDDDALEFMQSEHADPSRRPTLTVTYEP